MSSKYKYAGKSSVIDVFGDKWNFISCKHYRPDHSKLQKKSNFLDNDFVNVIKEKDNEVFNVEFGTSKKVYRIDIESYIDSYKDCKD